MITKNYTMQKDSYPLSFDKKKSKGIKFSSFDYPPLNISNFKNHSEPLNHNSKELSFKGSSPIKATFYYNVSDSIKRFGKIFGKSAEKYLEERIKYVAEYSKSGVKFEKDTISFKQKTIGEKLLDIVLYPVLKMPLDIANSTIKVLKKIPGLQKSKFIDGIYNSNILSERREHIKHTSDVAAIEHYFEQISQKTKKIMDDKTNKEIEAPITPEEIDKNLFDIAHQRFKPYVSNYDTTTERTLTRFVTGMIPAFYLANDAYNLSMYMKNDTNDAEKDKKRRFNQETARILITSAFTFATMSLFAKKTNESAAFATLLSSGVVFVSEIVGRLISGTPILPVGENQAKKYAALQDRMYNKKTKDEDEKSDSADTFKGFEGKKQPKEYKKPPEKGNLTIKNVLKAMAVLAVAGLGFDRIKNIKSVNKVLKDISSGYKNLIQKDFVISKKEFAHLTQKLEDNGFKEIADDYRNTVNKFSDKSKTQGTEIILGKTKDKTKDMLIHQILLFPVRFAWDTIMMPYKQILKPLLNLMDKNILKSIGVEPIETAEEKAASKIKKSAEKKLESLRDSIQFLQKIDGAENYTEKVQKSVLSSLDNVTKSSYSNSDLAAIGKIATSGVTSVFLIADNYNQVMTESYGENKELASQKAKERTIQRAVRIAYGAFLIKLFNGIFAGPYNGSLLGAQLVNIGNTAVIESLERKSVGLPIGKSTRENIIKEEKENLNARGLKGGYFRLMAKLTGKKSLSEIAVAKENKEKLKIAA